MSRIRTTAALAAVIASAAFAASSLAAASHAKFWQNKKATVVCGIKRGSKTLVLCSSKGIPRAKTGTGDPFVQIGMTGKPQLVLLSQKSFVGSTPTTLSDGTTWSSRGVTCQLASNGTVLCFNSENHGFRIGDNHYHSF